MRWRRRTREPETGSRFVNVAPDGRGGGVWVDVNAPPIPASTSLGPAMPPAQRPYDPENPFVGSHCWQDVIDWPFRKPPVREPPVRPAGTYR